MALIRKFVKVEKDKQRVHESVECGYSVFAGEGETYLQFDTYGSQERQIIGKISQSIQLDRESAAKIIEVIRRTFPGL